MGSKLQQKKGSTSINPKAKGKKGTRKLKRHEVRIRSADQVPKIMVVIGDTLVVRDFILNDLKHRYNLSI